MYEAFYGFREKPFSLLPDPAFLYLGKRHSMALAMLEYGVRNQAGFTVVAGEIGAGKTTLVRRLLDSLDQDVTVGLISHTHSSFSELLEWVLLAFGLDYQGLDKVGRFQRFTDFLIHEYSRRRRTVLIIDEAQNLGPETLEELRMLSNINADKSLVLQLVLVGQPELRDLLRRPELKQFAQRVSVAFYLEALSAEEVVNYVRHRLKTAGGDPRLFEEDALGLVHQASRGIPRVVNTICDMALVYGYAGGAPRIDRATVEEVIRDRAATGLFEAAEGEGEAADPGPLAPRAVRR
jgi:putative secretion ATPase (PEP-CTERM system associated)